MTKLQNVFQNTGIDTDGDKQVLVAEYAVLLEAEVCQVIGCETVIEKGEAFCKDCLHQMNTEI